MASKVDGAAAAKIVADWFAAYQAAFMAVAMRGPEADHYADVSYAERTQAAIAKVPKYAEFKRANEALAKLGASLNIDCHELFDLSGDIDGATAAVRDAAQSRANVIRAALASAGTSTATVTTPTTNVGRRSANALMKEKLEQDRNALDWTVEQWSAAIGKAKSTITDTATWKYLAGLRVTTAVENAMASGKSLDRRRKRRSKPNNSR